MANFGRFVCVLVPFLLTLAALAAMLVAGLAGIADKSLYMFRVNVTDLQLSQNSVSSILKGEGLPDITNVDLSGLGITKRQVQAGSTNITAKDLGLYDIYDVNVWNFCYTAENGTHDCTGSRFDWAANELNLTDGRDYSLVTPNGFNVTMPKEITDAVRAFVNVSKWTQVVFIIAYVALGVELLFGLFANCSRAFSCVTWLVAGFAVIATGAAAGLATATSVIIVGAVEASAEIYGVHGSLNTRFLAAIWLAVAFALAAGLFWMFTICCCKPDHHSRSHRNRGAESEKFMGGAAGGAGYSRLSEPGGYNGAYGQEYPRQAYGGQSGGAYEPYSHARV
ncbi:SUR7/PalI family-domain-containing protein [Dichotomopilus funicola]|uniref:SUR7/PalI family-domain-containing protein n=1 Tax=Dichotomopilus funicola TaxID=1934379 RepID=A0AAN6ZJ44_9PEZI|nr:SUR7/PalI family-domain-containing protein [Dichotomopilus funicola]